MKNTIFGTFDKNHYFPTSSLVLFTLSFKIVFKQSPMLGKIYWTMIYTVRVL